ncbi:MAG TPA: Ig-like domain-containing protein [Thermoanaerobaculia bacterium]
MKSIMLLVASFLLVSVSASNAFSGSLDDSKSPESPAVSTSPLLGVPAPTRMVCRVGWRANDDYIGTAKDTAVTFSPLSNDDDTPQQNFGGILSGPQHGTTEQVGLDSIKYIPATGYTGSDYFTYLHIGCLQCYGDGWSSWCSEESNDVATVYITVN